jgi:FKBP-type peptidyl-prolyl cis-trans isomerase 2
MTATASKGKVISLEYTLKLDNNEVIDTNVGKTTLTYTQGANQIIRGVETDGRGDDGRTSQPCDRGTSRGLRG